MKKVFSSNSRRVWHLLLPLCLILGTVMGATGGKRGSKGAREKARYYYRQALLEQVDSNPASAYELYKRAYLIDPTYSEAASAVASTRITLPLDTMRSDVEMRRSLGMMKQYVDEYPDDVNEALYYAFICTRVDSLAEAERVYRRVYDKNPQFTGILHNLSELSMIKGDVKGAVESLNRYERAEGASPQLTLRKVSYLLHGRDTIGAVEEVNRYVSQKPKEPVSYILRGNLYEILGQTDSIEANYLMAERVAPESGAAKIALADFYTEHGDSIKGDAKTYEALMSEDLELDDKLEILEKYLGKLLAQNKDTERGDRLFSVLAQQYPHQEELLELSARYNYAKGDVLKAIDEIDYAIGLSPANPLYYSQKLTYMLGLGLPDEIKKVYSSAKDHLSKSETDKMLMLYALGLSNDDDKERGIRNLEVLKDEVLPELKGKEILERSDVLGIDNGRKYVGAQIFSMMGDLRQQMTDKTGWKEAYNNSLVLMPDYAMTLNNYAYFEAIEGGDLDDAENKSRRAVELDSRNATFLDTMGWIKYLQGNYEEARRQIETAMEYAEADGGNVSAEYYEHLEKILTALGDTEGASAASVKYQKAKDAEDKAEAAEKEKVEKLRREYKQMMTK